MAGKKPTPLEQAAAPTYQRIDRDREATPREWVRRILTCVRNHLFRPGFNVEQLRATLGLRDNTVAEQFRLALGVTLRTYLEECRLETSCRLLLNADLLVGSIARLVGYEFPATFSRAFHRRIGCSPTRYRTSGGAAGRRPGRPQGNARRQRQPPPRLPRFLAGQATISERQRCHRCRVPLCAGRGIRMFENLEPICDLCAHEHGPPQLSALLKECIVEDEAISEDHVRRLVLQTTGRRRQLSQPEADSLIWSLLCLYPDSLEVVREHVATRVRKQRENVGRPLLPESPDGDQGVDPSPVTSELARLLEASEQERIRAVEVWRVIEDLPCGERKERIRGLEPPLRTDALFVLLHRESQELIRDHPRRSRELAELALIAVQAMDRTLVGRIRSKEIEADAWAWLANARRTACDLAGADEALTRAYECYHEGPRTTLQLARFLDYEGSLRRDQRRFDEALVCLERALEIYRNAGDESHLAGKILIEKATVHHQACRPGRGVPILRQALPLIDPETHPLLLLNGYFNLCLCLGESDRFEEATRILPLLEELSAETGQRMDRARVEWLRGRISAGSGDAQQAIQRLKAAQTTFLELGSPYDAALVALDLAAILADGGREEEMSALGRWIAALLKGSEFHGDTVAALTILRGALESNDLSADLARRLRKYLKQARFNHDLRFQDVK